MWKQSIIFFLFLVTRLYCGKVSSPSELASIQSEPSTLIYGCVNAITGDLIFEQLDMVVKGVQPISIPRKHISSISNHSLSMEDQLLPFRKACAYTWAKTPFQIGHLSIQEPANWQ